MNQKTGGNKDFLSTWTVLVLSSRHKLLCMHNGAPLAAQLVKSACNAGDLGSIPGLGGSPGGGHGNPLQYFCLENPHGQRSLQSMGSKRVRHA